MSNRTQSWNQFAEANKRNIYYWNIRLECLRETNFFIKAESCWLMNFKQVLRYCVFYPCSLIVISAWSSHRFTSRDYSTFNLCKTYLFTYVTIKNMIDITFENTSYVIF